MQRSAGRQDGVAPYAGPGQTSYGGPGQTSYGARHAEPSLAPARTPYAGVPAVPALPPVAAEGIPPPPPPLRRWLWFGGTGVVFTVLGLLLVALIYGEVGLFSEVLGVAAALLPLAIVVPAVLWLDRFEHEPTRYLVVTFLWGACVAAGVAIVLNTASLLVLAHVSGRDRAQEIGLVIVAPVVEESLKGLGVLLVLLFRRREFDGVVDGIVYAGLAAAGFAFTENVIYLGHAFTEDGAEGLAVVLILRGLLSPFAHPMFTACTGVGLGIAAGQARGAWRWFAPLFGLLGAMSLHALWNGSTLLGARGMLTLYVVLQVPLFAGAVAFAAWARRREGRVIGEQLAGYLPSGWYHPTEVAMLANLGARRQARTWARGIGGSAGLSDMRRFQDQSTELALLRLRMGRGTAPMDAVAQEAGLLAETRWLRRRLYGSATAGRA